MCIRDRAVAELDLPAGRVKRDEELVLGERDVTAHERVEERGLAGVRVADDRHRRVETAVPAAGRRRTLLADLLHALLHLLDPFADQPAIGFQLALAGPPGADPAAGPGEVR